MAIRNNKLGKFFTPSSSYAGYVLMAAGLVTLSYSLISLTLVIPGIFLAFTYTGTYIDLDKKRVKPYTALFGITRTGKWINAKEFTKFSIIKATKNYTTYSRANVRFDMGISDIELLLVNENKTKKVILKKFKNFEDAHKEMDELSNLLTPQ